MEHQEVRTYDNMLDCQEGYGYFIFQHKRNEGFYYANDFKCHVTSNSLEKVQEHVKLESRKRKDWFIAPYVKTNGGKVPIHKKLPYYLISNENGKVFINLMTEKFYNSWKND